MFRRDHRAFVQRVYVHNNYGFVRNYNVNYWGRHRFYSYAPRYVYNPFFIGWIWRPWAPFYYRWWWYDDPWFAYYGYYWRPYPYYYGPSFWITDFVMADILAAEYAAANHSEAERNRDEINAILDERVKNQVRAEVEAEMKAREKQQSVPMDEALKTNYVYVLSNDMNVAVAGSNETCSLSPGDIIKVSQSPSKGDEAVKMTVVTSKKGSCGPNKHILVSLDDLQDMKNNFSESVDKGLKKLSEQQGKNGLPAAPASAQEKPQEILTEQEKAQAIEEAKDAAKTIETQPTQGNP